MVRHNERGAWLFEGGHTFDANLAAGIVFVLQPVIKSVVDIGCGDGSYVKYMQSAGLDVIGYDGNPLTEDITSGQCFCADFSEPQYLGIHDAVLCLEVGEHIPADYETVFLDNLARHAEKVIILSWAIPGQGGFGHVNERSNAYIIEIMKLYGWSIDWEKTGYLREMASVAWFKDTVMVFTHGD